MNNKFKSQLLTKDAAIISHLRIVSEHLFNFDLDEKCQYRLNRFIAKFGTIIGMSKEQAFVAEQTAYRGLAESLIIIWRNIHR